MPPAQTALRKPIAMPLPTPDAGGAARRERVGDRADRRAREGRDSSVEHDGDRADAQRAAAPATARRRARRAR